MLNPHDFRTTYAELTTLLAVEEGAGSPKGVADLEARLRQRATLETSLQLLEDALSQVRRRMDHLPRLPRMEHLRWAQAVLAFPNLAFLEVDTDGLHRDADILRIVLVDRSGTPLYAQLFKPRRPLIHQTTHLTAIHQEMVEDAPLLADAWEQIASAFTGRYVLSYNLEFDQTKLHENAERYSLSPLTVIGACLMQQAQAYAGSYAYPKLATLCTNIGFPLPEHPHQTAFDRVRGQIHLLEAMAQGITSSSSSHETPHHEHVAQDDDPFAVE
jgi:DNA polymerase III epsilon subunit-like protein